MHQPSSHALIDTVRAFVATLEKASPQERKMAYGTIVALLDDIGRSGEKRSPERVAETKLDLYYFCFPEEVPTSLSLVDQSIVSLKFVF
jgi:hypothetical protein